MIRNFMRARSGFTLIELAVVVCIVAVLAATLLNRVLFYQEQAEKAAAEQLLGTLRSALHLQIADRLLKGGDTEVARLIEQNPMDWLAEKPKNYVGEYYNPEPGLIESGNWYFDLRDKSLVYLVKSNAHLQTAPGELNKLRFKVKGVNALPVPASAVPASVEKPALEGVTLETVQQYSWF